MSLMGVFNGIGHQIGDNLLDTAGIDGSDQGAIGVIFDELDSWFLNTFPQRLADVVE